MINPNTIINFNDPKVVDNFPSYVHKEWIMKDVEKFVKLIPKNGIRVKGQGYSYYLKPTSAGWDAESSDGGDFKIKFFTDIHEWAFDEFGLERFLQTIFESADDGKLDPQMFAFTRIDQEQHEDEQLRGGCIVNRVLKEANWINRIVKTASENNLTAEQQEKINAELDNSTVSFQELAHQMSPIVKAGVEDIYQYLLNEKSYWQYKHRIAGKKIKCPHCKRMVDKKKVEDEEMCPACGSTYYDYADYQGRKKGWEKE